MSYRGMSTAIEIKGEYPTYGDYVGLPGTTLYKGVNNKWYTGTPKVQGYSHFLDLTEITEEQYNKLKSYGIIK